MIPWMQAHLYTTLIVSWLLMNAINTMPTPRDSSSALYTWAFKFLQTIGGSIPRLLAIYSPNTLSNLTGQSPKMTIPPNPPEVKGA